MCAKARILVVRSLLEPSLLRFISLGFVVCLLLASCASVQRQRVRANSHYQRGLTLLASTGQEAGAEAALRKAIQIDPQFAPPHNALGQLWAWSGTHTREEIVAEFEAAVRLDPHFAEAHYNLGRIYIENPAQGAAAIAHLQTAVRTNPDYAEAWGLLAEALRVVPDWEGALAACRRAVALTPADPYAWFRLGGVLADGTGNVDEAVEAFRTSLKFDPKLTISHTRLGLLLLNDPQRKTEALYHMQEAVRLEPVWLHWVNLGRVQVQTGDPAAAMESVNQALQLNSDDFSAYKLRGDLRLAGQDLDGAIADFQKVIDLNPQYLEVIMQLGGLRAQKGDMAGSIETYSRVISLAPNYAAPYAHRAMSLAWKGDLAAALADATRAIDLEPGVPMAWAVRGMINSRRGEFEASIADFSRVIALLPADHTQWINRSEARRLSNDLAGAIADATEAIRLRPDEAGAYLLRGQMEGMRGNLAVALADLDQSIALDPQNPASFMARGLVRDLSGDFSGALEDHEKSMTAQTPHTAYTGFWSALLRQRLHSAAKAQDLAAGLDETSDEWTKTIARFLGGSCDEPALLAAAATGQDNVTTKRRCEAFYYAGMLRLLAKNDPIGACELFEKCVATNVTDFSEYRFAKVELARLAGTKH